MLIGPREPSLATGPSSGLFRTKAESAPTISTLTEFVRHGRPLHGAVLGWVHRWMCENTRREPRLAMWPFIGHRYQFHRPVSVPAVDTHPPSPIYPHVEGDGISTRNQQTAESVLLSIAWSIAMAVTTKTLGRFSSHGWSLRGTALSSSIGGRTYETTPPPMASAQYSSSKWVHAVHFLRCCPSLAPIDGEPRLA